MYKRKGLEVVPENILFPKPPPNPHVTPVGFEEDEQEDIIRITMVPQEASFDDEGEETIELKEQNPDLTHFVDTTEPSEVYRPDILSAEAILKEAEQFARDQGVDPHA